MSAFYKVELKLPLPRGPLGRGYPEPDNRPIPFHLLQPVEYTAAIDALRHAARLVEEGYGVSISDAEGREWSHTEVLRRLERVSSRSEPQQA